MYEEAGVHIGGRHTADSEKTQRKTAAGLTYGGTLIRLKTLQSLS